MPSLFRFLLTLIVLGGLVYLGMLALVTFIHPQPHQIIEPIPAARLNKPAAVSQTNK